MTVSVARAMVQVIPPPRDCLCDADQPDRCDGFGDAARWPEPYRWADLDRPEP